MKLVNTRQRARVTSLGHPSKAQQSSTPKRDATCQSCLLFSCFVWHSFRKSYQKRFSFNFLKAQNKTFNFFFRNKSKTKFSRNNSKSKARAREMMGRNERKRKLLLNRVEEHEREKLLNSCSKANKFKRWEELEILFVSLFVEKTWNRKMNCIKIEKSLFMKQKLRY